LKSNICTEKELVLLGGSWMFNLGEEISYLENNYFVGRKSELDLFRNFFLRSEHNKRILNVFGTGGVGKSTLIEQFKQISAQEEIPFVFLDCLDFSKTPKGLATQLLKVMNIEVWEETPENEVVMKATTQLNQLALKSQMVLAIDTFEEMNTLDHWLRQHFLKGLSNHVLIVLSGRFQLNGGWVLSPAWRKLITFLPLSHFDFQTCKEYTNMFGSYSETFIQKSYTITKGHPLALSLFMGLNEKEEHMEDSDTEDLWNRTFKEIAVQWLRELTDDSLRNLLEATTIVRVFNHEVLECMLNREITNEEFEKLIQLSFVRKSERGWYLHQVLRKSLYQDFKLKKPHKYKEMWYRSIHYYYDVFMSGYHPTEERHLLLYDFIYIVGAPSLRAFFYDDAIDQNYYIDSINQENIEEAEQYVNEVLLNLQDYEQAMYDPVTNEKYIYSIPKSVNEKWFTAINLVELLPLGSDTIRLLKNEKHEAVGMFIYIPIHRESLPLLKKNPITKSYFRAISEEERIKLDVPPECPAGWFQYKIDFSKDGSAAARFMFYQTNLAYFLKGGIIVYTTPMKYNQEVVKGIGYREVVGATHKGFGHDYPAPTLVLDFREDKELKKFVEHLYRSTAGYSENLNLLLSKLTPREREIALLTKTCSSNLEIAQKLYLSEITIKKNLSCIYEKLEVKGKADLIKKLFH
jgi:DNA-binding CsgD family transcriptional regulator/GTPase SAR1 family protein